MVLRSAGVIQNSLLIHSVLTVLVILAGIQDWRTREVSDWLTWPLFIGGTSVVITRHENLSFLPLIVSAFLLIAWYFNWMGGADVRVLVGLWGLWPLAGILSLLANGLWGAVLVLRKRGKEKLPGMVGSGFAVATLFIVEHHHF